MQEDIDIEPFRTEDYDQALALWKRTPGMGLSSVDERKPIEEFLALNPGLSFAAWAGGLLVGTALCGTDGRRGFLYHLAIDTAYRRQGTGLGARLALPGSAEDGRDRKVPPFRARGQ